MDGTHLRFSGDILKNNFTIDKYGSYIPNPSNLRMEGVSKRVIRQLSADTGLERRMAQMYRRTDVLFTDNPLGNTPVFGAGVKMFGARPSVQYKRSKGDLSLQTFATSKIQAVLNKREGKLDEFQKEVLSLHKSLEPAIDAKDARIIWDVERDQAMTGGGFDNNKIGDVQKSALNFIIKSNTKMEYADSVLSKYVVEGSQWLAKKFEGWGLERGSIKPEQAQQVRFEQDNDGMIGFPALSKGNAPLTNDIALRLLIDTGVDTRRFVGTRVVDKFNQQGYKFRVIDAMAYVLDNLVATEDNLLSIVVLLARIQKHGYHEANNPLGFESKPGKTRSVYPNAAIPGLIEAMIISPFNKRLKELVVPFMPSLQDEQTRVSMITKMIKDAQSKGYDFLAADWSKYDATVKGAILATVIQYAVKPFINAQYYDWIDAATYILTFKYIVVDKDLAMINNDDYQIALKSGPHVECGRYDIFGLVDGLISGAKFTHVGGSMYGEVCIHYVIPKLLNYVPIIGAQAGDDTLMGIPMSMINPGDQVGTYTPIAEAAKLLGLDINPGKQIWHQQDGEIAKVFLQELYHASTNVFGIGSAFRPLDAVFTSEGRSANLTIGGQLIAEIARMNQGFNNPFIEPVVKFWLSKEQFLGALFKERGASEAFSALVENTGLPLDQVAKRIDVGSFSFGMGKEAFNTGRIPILDVMARVASKESYSVNVSEVLKTLNVQASKLDEMDSLFPNSESESSDVDDVGIGTFLGD